MTNATMTKVELRIACKAVSIAYSKLNNEGMRVAMEALHPAPTEQEHPPGSSPDIDGWDSDAG